jgi:hypothetical protein
MKLCPAGAEIFYADGQTEKEIKRYDEANGPFSLLCERTKQVTEFLWKWIPTTLKTSCYILSYWIIFVLVTCGVWLFSFVCDLYSVGSWMQIVLRFGKVWQVLLQCMYDILYLTCSGVYRCVTSYISVWSLCTLAPSVISVPLFYLATEFILF